MQFCMLNLNMPFARRFEFEKGARNWETVKVTQKIDFWGFQHPESVREQKGKQNDMIARGYRKMSGLSNPSVENEIPPLLHLENPKTSKAPP